MFRSWNDSLLGIILIHFDVFTGSHKKMAEENVRLDNMQNEMKMVFHALENLTKQIESINGKLAPTPAAIEVMLPLPSTGKDKVSASDSKMLLLEDNLFPLAVRKAEPESVPMTEHGKRLAKVEEMLK